MTQVGHSGTSVISAREWWTEAEGDLGLLPHQVPPDGTWDVWLLLGGRGSGKTMAGTQYVLSHLRE